MWPGCTAGPSVARGATVYLLPGLTTCQRRAAIRRLRQEASRGLGPELPLPQLAIALGLDRVRTAARIVGAVVRQHPAGTLVPGAFVIAMTALFVIASGNRPGIAPSTRAGLAAATASGDAQAVGAGSGGARPPRETGADGPAVRIAGEPGLAQAGAPWANGRPAVSSGMSSRFA